jgi:cold shock CspA family protein/ribosome-associated translation inhibitor RaiA
MIPLTISFRGMEPSEAIESLVREQASALERFFPRILRCRVVIELPHRHHRAGAPLHVRIDLHVPGQEIVVEHQPGLHAELQRDEAGSASKSTEVAAPLADPALAIREAFRSAGRRLQDDVRRLQGDVKVHEPAATARVARILSDQDCGFLETPEGREIYFHANSVLNHRFDRLVVGDAVRFVEEAGDQGPQASTVRVLSRRAP